jgi:hypothetical protein
LNSCRTGGIKYPEKVEVFYKKDLSKELLNTALKASQDFFNGKHFNSTATGEGLVLTLITSKQSVTESN